jgi:hypothetical protein
MNYLITEEQLLLIAESINSPKVMESVRKLNSFTTKMVNRVMKKYKLNVRLLLTWGPSMGGLVMPLDNFIRSGNISLNEEQIALILCGVAGVLFYDNEENINILKNKIKSEGLGEAFEKVLEKGRDLKYAFGQFIESIGVTITSVSDILSYAFLIPIVPDLAAFFSRTQNFEKTITLIGERLVASGLILISADLIIKIFRKIKERLN